MLLFWISGRGGIGTNSSVPCPLLPEFATPPEWQRPSLPAAVAGEGLQQQLGCGPQTPPDLPPCLAFQTPGKSEFLWKLKLCLLDQTGVGVGVALCQVVGMEGKRQLEGTEPEGVRALLLPACARPGDCRLQPAWARVGGSGRLRAGSLCVGCREVGASRQDIRCTLPVNQSLAVPSWLFLQYRRLLAGPESWERPPTHLLLLVCKDPCILPHSSPTLPSQPHTQSHAHPHTAPASGGHPDGEDGPVCSSGHMRLPALTQFPIWPPSRAGWLLVQGQ